jgi:hypothetical protein
VARLLVISPRIRLRQGKDVMTRPGCCTEIAALLFKKDQATSEI